MKILISSSKEVLKYVYFRTEWFRNLSIWKYYAKYFPVKLIKTAELDPSKGNYLFGNHPHGILCSGVFASFLTDGCGWSTIFPNLSPCVLTLQGFHQAPGLRELARTSGNVKYFVKLIWRKKIVNLLERVCCTPKKAHVITFTMRSLTFIKFNRIFIRLVPGFMHFF